MRAPLRILPKEYEKLLFEGMELHLLIHSNNRGEAIRTSETKEQHKRTEAKSVFSAYFRDAILGSSVFKASWFSGDS